VGQQLTLSVSGVQYLDSGYVQGCASIF